MIRAGSRIVRRRGVDPHPARRAARVARRRSVGVAPLRVAHRAAVVYVAHSLRGRTIAAYHVGDGSAPRVLVFGSIHGDETAGIPIAERLLDEPAGRGADIWVVPDLNPDGTALHRRQNGDGIDLNRNFPYRWQPIGRRRPLRLSRPAAALGARVAVRGAPDPDAAPVDHDLVPPGAARRRPLRRIARARAALRPARGPAGAAARALPGKRPHLAEPPLPGHHVVRRRAAGGNALGAGPSERYAHAVATIASSGARRS